MVACNKKCEVYSRIVGYYRPVDQWNLGKQEEFKERLEYTEEKGMSTRFRASMGQLEMEEAAPEVTMNAGDIRSYKIFSFPNCDKCTTVKEFLSVTALDGSDTNLGADDGVAELRQYYRTIKDMVRRNEDGSLLVPTVLFFDGEKNIVGAAHDVAQIKGLLG